MNTPANPHHDGSPADWIVRYAHLVRAGARVLDVAAGRGRHARFFAARGAEVVAVDRDADALAAVDGVPGVITHVADLEAGEWPFGDARFDAIVVVHYLHRALLPTLRGALAPGGVLLYETFATGNEAFGRPRNPDFLLAPGELLGFAAQAPALTVVAFEQGVVHRADAAAVVQRLAAVAPGHAWPPLLAPAGQGGATPRIG
jgi:SAM-dependent methyltransferase